MQQYKTTNTFKLTYITDSPKNALQSTYIIAEESLLSGNSGKQSPWLQTSQSDGQSAYFCHPFFPLKSHRGNAMS